MPVSGAAAYTIPTICTAVTQPTAAAFYMSNQLPPNTVQTHNMCSSIHVPWPCVQARLPSQQVPNVSHNLQNTPNATMNPLMTFAPAPGSHAGSVLPTPAQPGVPSNSSRAMSNTQRFQVSYHYPGSLLAYGYCARLI